MPGIFRKGEQVTDVLVNGLEGLIEKNLLRTSQLEPDLTHCGLGIDGSHYIRQLYSRENIRASLSAALGGIPLCFRTEVENDLAHFRRLDVNLLFVFDGLDLYNFNVKDKGMKVQPAVVKRNLAWDAWNKLAERGRGDSNELEKQVYEAFEHGIFSIWRAID
jgi:hypothetical protein